MRAKVRLFARLSELAGTRETEVELGQGLSAQLRTTEEGTIQLQETPEERERREEEEARERERREREGEG